MAQFRTTADLIDSILTRCGETTNGNSSYDSDGTVLSFLNRVHFSIVAGGTIALGKDTTVEIDEVWPWAKSKRPLVLELQPKYATGSVALTLGDTTGTFSDAPTYSVAGWYMRVDGVEGIYRIASHTASSTLFTLDGLWPSDTLTAATFTIFKLDYELTPTYIVIDETNNKIQFQEVVGTTLTGTLTKGTYSPSDLITAVAAAMSIVGTSTYTGSYSSTTKLFTISSTRTGGVVFILVGTGDQSDYSVHRTLGFDDANTTNAASVTSTYVLGGISRLVEPVRIHRGAQGEIYGCDPETFIRDWPLVAIEEGDPDRFTLIKENADGSMTLRMNRYPAYKTRIEFDFIPIPRDLKDSPSSIPLLPRKHVDVLEDAGSFYIMLLKNDDRATTFASLTQGKLSQMISQNRGQLQRYGTNFGSIVPRADLVASRRRFHYGYTTTSSSTSSSSSVQTMIKVTLSYSDFQGASTTKSVTARTLPSNRSLFSVIIKHTTAFAGSGLSAITISLGITGDLTKFINNFNILQAVSSSAQDSAITIYFPGVATPIIATVTATGANTSALNAGSVDIYFNEVVTS